jgi:hypothetical protein
MSGKAAAAPGVLIALIMVMFLLTLFLIEFDRSQLRDLQRRVAELEQKR